MILYITVILLFCFVALNQIYKGTNHYMFYYGSLKRQLQKLKEGLDVVSIGSTQAYYDFDWDGIQNKEIKGGNMSSNPQSLRNSFAVLREYIGKMNPGSKLLFTPPLCIFFFTIMPQMQI